MNLKKIIKEEILKETTTDSSSIGGHRGGGQYVAPMRPGLRLFDSEQLQPFTVKVSKYDDALLNYDSLDGKMDEPKKVIKKLETQAIKSSEYAKNHPTLNDDSGESINPFPNGKQKKHSIKKTIKEELLKEVGGYDDPNVMAQHANTVMSNLRNTMSELNLALIGFSGILTQSDFSHLKISEETEELINLISESIMVINISLENFTEDDLISKGKNFIKQLTSLSDRVRYLNQMKFDYTSKGYIKELAQTVFDTVTSLRNFTKSFVNTDKMFRQRFDAQKGNQENDQFSNN